MNPFFLGCGPPALASNSRMVHGPSGASDAALEADCESTGGFLAGCVALRQQGGSVPVGTAAPQLGEEAGSADGVSWSVFFGSLVGVFLLTMLTTALVVGCVVSEPTRADKIRHMKIVENAVQKVGSIKRSSSIVISKRSGSGPAKQVSMTFARSDTIASEAGAATVPHQMAIAEVSAEARPSAA